MRSKRRNRSVSVLFLLVAVGWALERRLARALWADELRMLDWPSGPGPTPRADESAATADASVAPLSVGARRG
jgi:hypothetical protein